MRILSVDGGGYLGLSTAAFIEGAERHFGKSFHSQFDLFCGTSTGAIIALALASGMSGKQIRELYEDFGPRVFDNKLPLQRWGRFVRGLVTSRYDNAALRASLQGVFGDRTLGQLHESGKKVLVTAFSMTSGRPRIFKTDHGPGLSRDNGRLIREVALASASAPVYLPLVELKDPQTGHVESYCDGGVFANHPALLGFTEAMFHCGAEAKDVRVLSLSTPRASLAEHKSAKKFLEGQLNRGAFGWGWDGKLASVFIDANSMITHETLRRLAERPCGAKYVRVALDKPEGLEMDIATESATKTLKHIGFDAAGQGEVRGRLAAYF